ncbi:MAG: SulP family inorganic anion transporter [Actinobacteria bacterium]|nr:SulP family inorganic anion transporter [Actinomycetota bacterium]
MGVSVAGARALTRRYLRRFGGKATWGADARAGLVLGIESVPDGLAAGLLAGVNPLHGLYAYLMGTLGGALATGSLFMTVQSTGAMAVIISDVPQTQSGSQAASALATLAVLAGIIMLALGLARLGSLVRFIPTAVLVGFINAVAVSIVLGQLDDFTGYESQGSNRVLRAVDTVLHVFRFHWGAVLVGACAIALILLLERTPLGALAMVVAVVAASALAALLSALLPGSAIALVADVATVPNALPGLHPPSLGMVWELLVPALSIALVGLVQGAAISGSIPNPDGAYPDASADFRGQGVANLVAGVFQGMPVGGSMSATALVRAAGAKSAAANLIAAVVMAVTIVLLGPAIGFVAMPALAGLLILVGIRTLKIHDILLVLRTGPIQMTVIAVTFVLTLLIPLQYAVLAGVGLAVVLHIARQANRVNVRRWVFSADSALPTEVDPPKHLSAREVVVLVPYGSLFFAAAPLVEAQLPRIPERCERAVVILRLRGKDELGSTFIRALSHYSTALSAAGGRLMLVGVGPKVHDQLVTTAAMDLLGAENVYPATARVGDALARALNTAGTWVAEDRDPETRRPPQEEPGS